MFFLYILKVLILKIYIIFHEKSLSKYLTPESYKHETFLSLSFSIFLFSFYTHIQAVCINLFIEEFLKSTSDHMYNIPGHHNMIMCPQTKANLCTDDVVRMPESWWLMGSMWGSGVWCICMSEDGETSTSTTTYSKNYDTSYDSSFNSCHQIWRPKSQLRHRWRIQSLLQVPDLDKTNKCNIPSY